MLVWKILLVIAALLVWLCLLRVGVRAAFSDNGITVDARIGWLRFKAYPRQKKDLREKDVKEKKTENTEKSKLAVKDIITMVRSAVRELLPPLKRSLARIGRGIRIQPLQLYVVLGAADDPAAGAQLYGEVNAAVWTVMPVLEQMIDIRNPYIQVDVDFDAPKAVLRGEAGLSIRIGTLFAAVFGIGIPALRWFLRTQKQQKNTHTPAETVAAGETVA